MKHAPKGFTLIELLLVIAILTLLAGVILTAANNSRNKAADARIKADMHTIIVQSSLHYTSAGKSFGTQPWTANATSFTPGTGMNGSTPFFQDRTIGLAVSSAATQGGAVSYGANDVSWVVISRLKTGGYWCVDSGAKGGGTWSYYQPNPTYNYGTPAYSCR